MKSPKATRKVITYTYPEPIPQGDERIDEEVLELGEGEQLPWVKIRISRSKDDIDSVADLTQSLFTVGEDDGTKVQQQIKKGNKGVFELLCEGWSFSQTFNMEPNATSFSELDIWAGDWISACLTDAVKQGTTRDYAKKTKNSLISQPQSPSDSPSLEQTVQESQ